MPNKKQRNYEILKARALKVEEGGIRSEVCQTVGGLSEPCRLFHVSEPQVWKCREVVRQRLLEDHGIGTISLGETELRVAYSCLEESDIETVFRTIAAVVEAL